MCIHCRLQHLQRICVTVSSLGYTNVYLFIYFNSRSAGLTEAAQAELPVMSWAVCPTERRGRAPSHNDGVSPPQRRGLAPLHNDGVSPPTTPGPCTVTQRWGRAPSHNDGVFLPNNVETVPPHTMLGPCPLTQRWGLQSSQRWDRAPSHNDGGLPPPQTLRPCPVTTLGRVLADTASLFHITPKISRCGISIIPGVFFSR